MGLEREFFRAEALKGGVGKLEELLDVVVGVHAVVLLEFGQKLFFGGFVVVQTELGGEEVPEFLLRRLEDVRGSGHPLQLGGLDRMFNFREFLGDRDNHGGTHSQTGLDDQDGCYEIFVLLIDLITGDGDMVFAEALNVDIELGVVGLQFDAQLVDLDELRLHGRDGLP